MHSRESSGEGWEGGPRKYAYNREGAREREMHLYLPYWGFSDSEKHAQQSIGTHPNVSRDNVLTVFAQLAALRMGAQRALISLFDKSMQHVVAEATPGLSLRGTETCERTEALWLGVCRLPRQKIAMCYHAVRSFVEDGEDIFVATDLAEDERFKHHPSVTAYPHNRFYVSVPIQSPDAYVIGSVAVLDDRPRDGVRDEQVRFLKELSATVMDHLLSQRAMREEYREEKMVRALGLFVRGKSDLNEWFYSRNSPDKKYGSKMAHINRRLEQLQVSVSSPDEDEEQQEWMDKDGEATTGKAKENKKYKYRSPVRKFGNQQDSKKEDEDEVDNKKSKRQRPRLSPTTSQLQETLAPSNVRSVVNRAASLIYQALDVEGAMFIDASVYARRQTMGSTETTHDTPEAYSIGNQVDEDQVPSASCPESGFQGSTDNEKEARSLVLGHFTSSTSDQAENLKNSHYISLSGAFVSHLIDQYPKGKIFHIEEDGSIALSYEGLADEMDYSENGGRGAQTTEAQKKDVQQETMDIKQLMKVLPDARCIAIFPVWDFQRSRWFAVNLVWTDDPGRVLSEPKDLTYMAAFSNTVMAEVSRLDLEAADRAKGDFISSISHELRSPLHGLLGTVELLQDMVNSYAQRSLIETIYSCGRTLLDTLNHLLDYAKINTLTRPRLSDMAGRQGGTDVSKPQSAAPGFLQDEDLGVLAQEVIEGLLAGAEYQRRGPNGNNGVAMKNNVNTPESRLMTIVDIEWQDSWQFSVYAGAWRRVVMNLFGNALKYTRTGYIRLLMKKDTLITDGKGPSAAVHITISDSGRGMSEDFLKNHLYSAFLQEDTTSPGLGVGLHLVHQIVKSLNGQIKFTSEVGRGTSVDVVLPVTPPERSTSVQSSDYTGLRDRLNGMTVSLFTRSSQMGDLGFDQQTFEDVLSSLGRMVSGWFGLRVLSHDELTYEQPDFAIITEHEYYKYYRQGSNEPAPDSSEIKPSLPLIVLGTRTSSWKALGETVDDSVIFLTQPVSPKTLSTAFEHCLGLSGHSEESMPKSDHCPHRPARKISQGSNRGPEVQANNSKPEHLQQTDVDGDDAATSDDKQESSNSEGEAQVNYMPGNILLVEDNQVNLKIIEMCVKSAGFKYQTASNGRDALEKFKADRYDAVVMDISMPVMDGLTATREMRHFERTKKLPPATIIILTAVLSASMQHETMISGANMFLTKPTSLKQLKEILQKLSEGKDVSDEMSS
ncbi:sensor histidine kinase/response regulator [Aspergillus nomiae NRRL 13137]|uniref:histidine kinase n=1 Tax=Aspergillus nomiae NRRL (strain ATCC 15546 / NRRL 13137 / CBS 260.88 / M93) TaxID=1509407 RepID=A0A0L1IWG7_ASPN3|nr:sensor histidine kinase/response regulator [Aspergillus nomiae NRRL 13137]KNG83844.1 sensor histidine kinase/response regulator [Aspergillus nomiae NRRL 13137]